MSHVQARWPIALALALCLAGQSGADWPHIRGPNYDGVSAETGLADAWPADGPPRLWTRDLGQGHSGFVIAGGRVFTQRQAIGGQYLLCLDADTGRTVWEYRYDVAWQPGGAYPGPYASPTWYRDRVYWASPTGLVGCNDAATGRLRWSLNVRDTFQGKGCNFGYAATPLIENDRVILPVGGADAGLVALHAEDGRTVWTAGSDPASYCPALPITFQGRRLVVAYLQNALVLADLATGTLVHRESLSSGYDEHAAWPIYREPHLLLTAPFRAPASCRRLAADGALLRLPPAWTSRSLANDVVSSVLYGEHVFGFDLHQPQASRHRPSRGIFRCLAWASGKVCWSTEEVGQAAVLAADGKLLMLSDNGTLILARADPTTYHELARATLFEDEVCWTPPALWQGRLFVRSPSRAVCVFVRQPAHAPAATAPIESASRSWRFDVTWLISREREYPNDALSEEELAVWFGAGVLDLATAGLIVLVARRWLVRLPPTPAFWGTAFVLGLLGPGPVSALADRLAFTWPLSLYVAFHATLLIGWWASRQVDRRHRWLGRLALAGLIVIGYGYFELCRAAGMYIAWAFLIGFPAALPLALLAVRAEMNGRRAWVVAAWTLPAFAVFFGSGQVLLWFKTAAETDFTVL
jgi:hypothetical protein